MNNKDRANHILKCTGGRACIPGTVGWALVEDHIFDELEAAEARGAAAERERNARCADEGAERMLDEAFLLPYASEHLSDQLYYAARQVQDLAAVIRGERERD